MESVLHLPFSPGWQNKNSELKISELRIVKFIVPPLCQALWLPGEFWKLQKVR